MKFKQQFIRRRASGFTLAEITVSMSILGLLAGGILLGYVQSLHRAEWAAYHLAANSLAQQRLEQARAAKWDTLAVPVVDRLISSNFPPLVEVLDVPLSGSNLVYATNFTTISQVSSTPPLKAVRVDCVWPFRRGRLFTNSVLTYRAPDQ